MPIGTPFHVRTSELCTSLFFKDWAGYHAVCSYDTCHEREYYALRQSAGLIDISPLFKYEVCGKDAAALLSRVTVRDITKLGVNRCSYLCWCDDDGKMLDDGQTIPCRVTVYPMVVERLKRRWKERKERKRHWFAPKEAAQLVAEPDLSDLLRKLDKRSGHRTQIEKLLKEV